MYNHHLFHIHSSIEHGGMRPFFYTVDQYFGYDSLEPFECILWLCWRFLPYGGTHNKALKCKNAALLTL